MDALQSLVGALVPRWHFSMLNDFTRNSRFADAIKRAAEAWRKTKKGGDAVRLLDIGSGTGLLSMVAADAGETFSSFPTICK